MAASRSPSSRTEPYAPRAARRAIPPGCIQRVDLATGRIDVLYESCDGVALRGPNDLVFDGAGGFWFTDMGKVVDRLIHRGAVYYARADGSRIVEAVFPIFTPNGIGLSPNGSTLYVAETDTARLWSFPITGEGELEQEPWPSPNGGRLVWGAGGYQRFDSLAVEAGGNICVATLVHGGISVCAPEGDLVEFHEAPEPFCTNLCFGGEQRRTAFITLSGTGRILAVDWPRPGVGLHF